jgi:hypothetical protein
MMDMRDDPVHPHAEWGPVEDAVRDVIGAARASPRAGSAAAPTMPKARVAPPAAAALARSLGGPASRAPIERLVVSQVVV